MPLSARYDKNGGFVETILSGIVTSEEATEEIEVAMALAEKNDCSLFLSDLSQANFELSIAEVFDLPKTQSEAGMPRTARIAQLVPQSTLGKELGEFYETISYNRGWTVCVFEEREKALGWLLSDSQ